MPFFNQKLPGYWGEIGFAYFTGGLAYILLNGISNSTMSLMAICSLLSLPYIFFSVFYQWRVAKQWCILCLAVQGVLAAEFIAAVAGNIYTADILNLVLTQHVMMLLVCFILPLVSWLTIKPILKSARENRQSKLALTRLKHNRQIFESQLVRQKKVLNDTNSMGLVLGNPNGTQKIIKVCNPYCGPCAKAHPEIHKLLEQFPDLQVQIIFTATSSEHDIKAPAVRHLLAISEEYDAATLDNALSHWYSSTEKNYDSFAAKFPVKGEVDKYNDKLNEMADWCKINGISYTPTFFINSFELPDMYEVGSLKYLLT